ncbi:hypothetical protein CHRY9390_02482 [Chryseobacterium aquaeductus]|uniref:Uncharacterized protein n=1 Tax=Chryseobacterium aquaeductus TaxID=2675056 RepID=A0A9N8QR83_9FLAO|nr:hypothetical protein [Chryseobacterium aquaeductus]CAA7331766.1 hypothetical protein CHRY9390_02482 [Chryseobacterium potabilaquae]CAD7812226.1 hypothetical protein CHRY9390_02482 [Chryseobacterium aquaeductus]
MKVSNCTILKIAAYVLLLFACAVLLAIAFVRETTLNILLIAVCCVVLFFFLRLKSVTYELSGECITIRKSHPLSTRKYVAPDIEFPQNYICDYHIVNGLTSRLLTIKIKSKRGKKFEIRLTLFGFSAIQKEKINSSLHSVITRNVNRDNLI